MRVAAGLDAQRGGAVAGDGLPVRVELLGALVEKQVAGQVRLSRASQQVPEQRPGQVVRGQDVVDRIREPESGAIVAVGEAGQGDRNGRMTGLAQPPGDRLPGPASLPGSGDEDEGG